MLSDELTCAELGPSHMTYFARVIETLVGPFLLLLCERSTMKRWLYLRSSCTSVAAMVYVVQCHWTNVGRQQYFVAISVINREKRSLSYQVETRMNTSVGTL